MTDLNKSIRLSTTPGGEDKYLNLKLEQNFDFLEVLSLKISQQDLYTSFCSNYGVVVGRVIANRGFGVPNAKVSIFIPISDEDEKNELIRDLYPYKTITDKNSDGYRYNLLLSKATCELNTSNGSFPDKETLLNNDIMIEVFEKYYKYTTKTNESGDYMLFGVPVGPRTLHMDVDLSDTGILSVRPYDLIAQGAPENFFANKAKFKESTNLDILPQIKTTNQNVDVIPFWGEPENCEIGITRLDIETNTEIEPTALFMGSIFTDKEKNALNKRCNPTNNMGELDELRTGNGTINFIRAKEINMVDWVSDKEVNPTELEFFDIKGGDLIDEDGTFVVPLPMNVGRIITNEFGDVVPSPDPEVGLPTKALYRMKMGFLEQPTARLRRTANMIFPSLSSEQGGTEGYVSSGDVEDIGGTEDQRFTDNVSDYKDIKRDFHLFEWKQIYTIAQYIKKYKKGANRFSFLGLKNTDKQGSVNNPLPFNTAVRKGDILFSILSLFVKIAAAFIKLIILLITFEFGFYFGLNVSIFGNSLFSFYRIIRIAPFTWLGGVFPSFCSDPEDDFCCVGNPDGRGFTLSCDGDPYCLLTNGSVCGADSGPPCCVGDNCSDPDVVTISEASGCGGDDCPQTSPVCLAGHFYLADEDTCAALATLEAWKCCVILKLAEERNIIRRSLFDVWVVGTSYLFQYKYKLKIKSNGTKKEKFCGPGSDTSGGNNYHKNKCCPHDTDQGGCEKCLVRGSEISDKNYGNIESYHKDWHNATVNGNCDGLPCGNGATDINDNIYCNSYNSTKIVSLGRIEMCPDILNDIETYIQANDGLFELYKQNPDFFTGTFYEDGWDPNFWSQSMGPTSYKDPFDVIQWLMTKNNCNVGALFAGGQGCHEKELKDEYYQWVKEISKIYTDIITVQTSLSIDSDNFEPGTEDVGGDVDENGPIISGYLFDNDLGQRFSPCGGDTGVDCNQPPLPWSGEDTQTIQSGPGSFDNASKNIPYYYFGLLPGRTAIDKLRKEYFIN
jgi:hypothetical protein